MTFTHTNETGRTGSENQNQVQLLLDESPGSPKVEMTSRNLSQVRPEEDSKTQSVNQIEFSTDRNSNRE